ncbi:MAG TPA: hypothetical protein VFK61_05325 [Candidatus Limnocylindria bacterium]|nr:hypothetical protein [Candidatus Limnocylindria bacterium]
MEGQRFTEGGRIALGAWVSGFPVDPAAMEHFSELSGRPPAIAHSFQRWQPGRPFDFAAVDAAAAIGAMPMVSWEPGPVLDAVVRGEWDAWVTAAAGSVAADGRPILLRFAHEMNLSQIPWFGPPEPFLTAWQRVHERFLAAGATNLRWVWSPYVDGPNATPLEAYLPPLDTVDWIGLDGYNWGRQGWRNLWAGFDELFVDSLAAVRSLAPQLPVMLAEIGCAARGGDKAAWMRDALLRAIPAHDMVRAVVWFHENKREHADWRVDSSASALEAWREAAADPRYSMRPEELLRIG